MVKIANWGGTLILIEGKHGITALDGAPEIISIEIPTFAEVEWVEHAFGHVHSGEVYMSGGDLFVKINNLVSARPTKLGYEVVENSGHVVKKAVRKKAVPCEVYYLKDAPQWKYLEIVKDHYLRSSSGAYNVVQLCGWVKQTIQLYMTTDSEIKVGELAGLQTYIDTRFGFKCVNGSYVSPNPNGGIDVILPKDVLKFYKEKS